MGAFPIYLAGRQGARIPSRLPGTQDITLWSHHLSHSSSMVRSSAPYKSATDLAIEHDATGLSITLQLLVSASCGLRPGPGGSTYPFLEEPLSWE